MEDLKSFIKQKKKKAKKLRGKHSPLSELVDNEHKILKIESIHCMKEVNNLFLVSVKNHSKLPKKRYFLTISIVSQSSDFLANIAKNFFKNHEEIRLVQYSLYPETSRINLLALLELENPKDYENSLNFLAESRKKYRREIMAMIDKLQS